MEPGPPLADPPRAHLVHRPQPQVPRLPPSALLPLRRRAGPTPGIRRNPKGRPRCAHRETGVRWARVPGSGHPLRLKDPPPGGIAPVNLEAATTHPFHGLLAGKTALITGGAGGIGSEMCRVFARAGARVAFCDIDVERGRQLEQELARAGTPVQFIAADVTSPEQVRRMVEAVAGHDGPLHVLVNNAGISGRPLGDGPVTDCPEPVWEQVLAVNLTGPYLVSRYAVPAIIRAGGGAVIHIASDDALVGP